MNTLGLSAPITVTLKHVTPDAVEFSAAERRRRQIPPALPQEVGVYEVRLRNASEISEPCPLDRIVYLIASDAFDARMRAIHLTKTNPYFCHATRMSDVNVQIAWK